MDLLIKESRIAGRGVFASRDVKKGELIIKFQGERVVGREAMDKRIREGKERIDDPLQIADDVFLDLDELSNSFNHSCDPNAGVKGENELFASRNIKRGEEITFDYSTTIGRDLDFNWRMRCLCEAKNCRKSIGNASTIPMKRIKEYAKREALPDFIRAQFKGE